ncbi:MAG: MFS transporter [Betaproteobacteria bacterium]|nr:MFS transporter [Betaproteobacteria bacterium]
MKRFWSANASPDTQAVMTLLLCFSLNMLGRGMSDSFAVFVLPLGREFGWSRAELMGAYSISLLVFAGSGPFAGALLDRYSHRRLYLTGLACLAASLLGASVADRLWEIYLCVGVLGGIALATLGMIPAAILLKRWFTRSLSTAMGIAYTGLGCGALLFVPAAQHLIDIAGWRVAYRSLGIFVAVLALLAGLLPWRRITHGRRAAAPAAAPEPAAAAAPAEPVLPDLLRALRRRMFWGLAGVFFFTSTGMFMVIIQIVAYLVAIGVPPLQAAGIFGIIGALSIVGMIGSGWLAGRIGFRAVGVGSYAISLVGIALFDMMSHVSHPALLVGFVIAFGIAQGTRGPLIATLCARQFAGPAAGSVFGIITAAGGFGGALGSLLAGVLFDVSGGYDLSFAVAAASLMLASVPFFVLPEFRTR